MAPFDGGGSSMHLPFFSCPSRYLRHTNRVSKRHMGACFMVRFTHKYKKNGEVTQITNASRL